MTIQDDIAPANLDIHIIMSFSKLAITAGFEHYSFTWYCEMRCSCTLATSCSLYMLMKWLTTRHGTKREKETQ